MNPTLRRLLWNIPVLLLIVTLAFGLVRLAPGGPFDQEQALAPDVKANLDRAYGLDLPLSQQYGASRTGIWVLLCGCVILVSTSCLAWAYQ